MVTVTLSCASKSHGCRTSLALTATDTITGGTRGHVRGTRRTITVAEAFPEIALEGDERLGRPATQAVAIMTTQA